jgi:hypothetical protein
MDVIFSVIVQIIYVSKLVVIPTMYAKLLFQWIVAPKTQLPLTTVLSLILVIPLRDVLSLLLIVLLSLLKIFVL